MLENLRAFIAANLDIVSTRRVIAMQRSLRGQAMNPDPSWVWARPDHLHVNVRDLDHVDAVLAIALADDLKKIVSSMPPVTVSLEKLVAYPSSCDARLLLYEVFDARQTLQSIAEQVEQLVRWLGFKPVESVYRPVLIVARSAQPIDVQSWLESVGSTSIGDAGMTEMAVYHLSETMRTSEYPCLARIAMPQAPRLHRSFGHRGSQWPRSRGSTRTQSGVEPASATAIPAAPKVPSIAMPPMAVVPKVPSSDQSVPSREPTETNRDSNEYPRGNRVP